MMKRNVGTYITQKVVGESFKAYIPAKLPPNPSIDMGKIYPYLEKASIALAELNGMHKVIPNTNLFIYMYVRKEALLSSQIEGTQSSFSDLILFENDQTPQVSIEDVEEVSNYVRAINYGIKRLGEGFPLSTRLLKEIHGILLSGGRGVTKLPGELRRSQNWIGGTRPGNALFVPPPVANMGECLSDLEKFMHDESIPMLVRAGIAHVQFETIHPFLDGNGRLGRLLITLLLCSEGLLDAPILYLSLYLKQNRKIYYDLLQEVRMQGTWETWLEFFLEGIYISAKKATQTALAINLLFELDLKNIESTGRQRFTCEKVLNILKQLPQVTVSYVAQTLEVSEPTARAALKKLVNLGILSEMQGLKTLQIYTYTKYLYILEEGADPLGVL